MTSDGHEHGNPPYDLFHCLGDERQAWFIIVGSIGVTFWYLMIALYPWRESVITASKDRRKMGWALILIFIACGFSGYAPNALSGWYAQLAYQIREVTLVVLNVVCPVFFYWSRRSVMLATKRSTGIEETVDQFFLRHDKSASEVSTSEAMRLIAELEVIRVHAIKENNETTKKQ